MTVIAKLIVIFMVRIADFLRRNQADSPIIQLIKSINQNLVTTLFLSNKIIESWEKISNE